MRRAQPWLTNRARVLRANDTSAERRVWHAIRNRQLGGYKFVRQLPLGPYFADFACRECNVIFEIDGATHNTEAEVTSDASRTTFLTQMGFRIFRAHNAEIYENLNGVLETLLTLGEGVTLASPTGAPSMLATHRRDRRKQRGDLASCCNFT
jgi:very-short-patch-repair endonuclease